MLKFLQSREKDRIQADFNTLAKERFYSLQKSINGYFEVLNSMGAAFAVSNNQVGKDEFRLIVQYALLRQPDVEVLQWIPRVPSSKRLQFEIAGFQDGFPDLQITERNAQGKIVSAVPRKEYFPLYYFEPFYIDYSNQGRPNVGFDYASEPILREAMEKARDNGSIAVTSRMKLSRLIRDSSGQYGCAFFLAVYQPEKSRYTHEERRLNLAGFVAGAFNIEKTVEVSLQAFQPAGIDIYLYDETAPPISGQRLLCMHRTRSQKRPSPISTLKERKAVTSFQWQKSFEVGGRIWSFLCRSNPDFLLTYNRWGPWIAFSTALLFTFLLSGYLFTLLHRTAQVERLVIKRTAELSQEITERKRAEKDVKESEERLKIIMDSVQAAIMVIDAESLKIVDVNPVAVEMIGFPKEQIIGETCYKFVCPHEKGKCPVIENGKTVDRSEGELVTANDKTIPVIKSVNSIMMKDRRYFVESFMDISERKQLEETLRALSLVDELTGIYNRRGFLTLAERDLKLAKRTHTPRVLLFIDLDQMKSINDTLGHQEGDLALIDTASILKQAFRDSDIIARIGGDEFVVLAAVTEVAERTRDPFKALTSRLQEKVGLHNETGNRRFKLSMSLGITHYSPESSCSVEALLSRADSQMYAQKKKLYSPAS
jgi:diguanylate cyclase (GGDEF)-like protein/PAS domain S-box-containing protein